MEKPEKQQDRRGFLAGLIALIGGFFSGDWWRRKEGVTRWRIPSKPGEIRKIPGDLEAGYKFTEGEEVTKEKLAALLDQSLLKHGAIANRPESAYEGDEETLTLKSGGLWKTPLSGVEDKTIARLPPANVREFGAVGDGVANDTAAIIAARDSGKRIIYFPPGRYLITERIDWAVEGMHIIGEDATILAGFQGTMMRIAADDITVRGLHLDGRRTEQPVGTNCYGYSIERARDVVIEGCWVHEIGRMGIRVSNSHGCRIRNNWITGIGKLDEAGKLVPEALAVNGIYVTASTPAGSTDNMIRGNFISRVAWAEHIAFEDLLLSLNDADGIQIQGAGGGDAVDRTDIFENHIEWCARRAVKIQESGTVVRGNRVLNCMAGITVTGGGKTYHVLSVTNNIFENIRTSAVGQGGGLLYNAQWVGNYFRNIGTFVFNQANLAVSTSPYELKNCLWANNRVEGVGQCFILIAGDAENLVIIGNQIRDYANDAAAPPANRFAIRFSSWNGVTKIKGVLISGNSFHGLEMDYGIRVSPIATGVTISNNYFSGVSEARAITEGGSNWGAALRLCNYVGNTVAEEGVRSNHFGLIPMAEPPTEPAPYRGMICYSFAGLDDAKSGAGLYYYAGPNALEGWKALIGPERKVTWASRAPTGAETDIRGSQVWNKDPSPGNPPGWVCTTSGSRGVRGVWKAMANIAS